MWNTHFLCILTCWTFLIWTHNRLNTTKTFTLNKMFLKISFHHAVINIAHDSIHLMNKNRNSFLDKATQINFPVSAIPYKKLIPGNTVADAIFISSQKVKSVRKVRELHFTAYIITSTVKFWSYEQYCFNNR